MDIRMSNGSAVSVADQVFNVEFKEALIHQVVVAYMAGARAGTKAQKTRSEVSGGGAKPWKQKGTGRARAGTIRSPLWRKGGVTFAAKPRDYSQKVNRKMYRVAMRSILSELYRQDRLVVLENVFLDSHKTKAFLKFAQDNQLGDNFLLVTDVMDANVYLGARNLIGITVIDSDALNPVVLLKHDKVVMDKVALEKVNGWLL